MTGRDAPRPSDLHAADPRPPARLVILDQSIKVLYQSMLVLSLYFLFVGHNLPGGGFVGGLTAGAAVSLRYVSGGADAVRSTFVVPSHVVLGSGLLMAAGTALLPVLLGGAVLEHSDYSTELPVFGDVKIVSALPFDIGVYLVVVGLVLMAFAAFGDDLPAIDAADVAEIDVAEIDVAEIDVAEIDVDSAGEQDAAGSDLGPAS